MSARQTRNAARKKRKDNQGRAKDLAPSSSSSSFSSSFPPTVVADAALKRTKRTRSTSRPLPHGHRASTKGKDSTKNKEDGRGEGGKDVAALGGAVDKDHSMHPIQSLDESDPPAYVEGKGEDDALPMKVSSEVRPVSVGWYVSVSVCLCLCVCVSVCLVSVCLCLCAAWTWLHIV